MLQDSFSWFRENWAKVGFFIALFLTIYLIFIVLPENQMNFVILLSTPLYMLHQVEEYILPGGFPRFLNQKVYRADPDKGPLGANAVLLINLVVWVVLPQSSLAALTKPDEAVWIPYFFLFQTLIHLVLSILGKRFYNPGLVSACLLHVPWSIWLIVMFLQARVIASPYWNGGVRVGLYIVLGMVIVGQALKYRSRRLVKGV